MMLTIEDSLSSKNTIKDYMKSMNLFSETPAKPRRDSLSSSHVPSFRPKSIIELLERLEIDPVELLLDLGFGKEEPDLCTKIPSRFISYPSRSKGINIRVFLQAQKQRLDIENPNLYGRFRQLEVLDQVTGVFSSLLNDVNAAQKKRGTKTGENSVDNHQNKAKRTRERWRRMCQLLKKVSKQTVTHQPSTQDYQISEKLSPDYFTTDRHNVFGNTKECFSENRIRSLLADEQLTTEDTSKSSYLPKPLRNILNIPLKQAHLARQSEIPIRERGQKKTELLLAKTLRKTSGIEGQSPDSFEMEEIQSFDEETSRGSNTGSVSEAEMTRTSSCQSDSSGFLEEPPEHLLRQNPFHSETLNFSSSRTESQSMLPCSSHFIFSCQSCEHESEDIISSSATTDSDHALAKPSPNTPWDNCGNREDGSLSSQQVEANVLPQFDGLRKGTALEMDQQGNGIETIENSSNSMQVDDEDAADAVTPKLDCLVPFYMVHTAFQCDGPPHENVETMCTNVQQDTHQDVTGKEGNINIISSAHRFVPVSGSVWPMHSHHMERSLERMNSDTPLTFSEVQNSKYASLGIHADIHSTEDEADCLQNKEPPKDSVQVTETSTNFYKSVTIQMSSNLLSGLQAASLSECFIKESSHDSRSMSLRDGENEEDEEALTSRLGEEEKRVKDSSIQTDCVGRKLEQHCPYSNYCFASGIHGFCFPTNSMSLNSGSFGQYEASTKNVQDICSEKCSHCSHRCCIHHCCLLRASPRAVLQSTPVSCCSNHTDIEFELLQTLKLLQDSLRELSPCSLHEMERMRNSCQHYREQLMEIEQLLIEQQALSSNALTMEGREESRRLQGLRRAVLQEIAELEFQLDDRIRQLKEGIIMQLEQLLEEQSKLYSELDFFSWREEEKTTNLCTTTDDALSSASTSHLVAECPVTLSSEEGSREELMDSEETKGLPAQQKMDFSTFLQNLKKSFQNSFGSVGSDKTEVRK